MNKNGIYTTNEETKNLNLASYSFPKGDGNFIGTLQFRRWAMKNKKYPALFCYFVTTSGERIILPLYYNRVKNYSPYIEGPDFKFSNYDGVKWYCEYGMTKNGSTKWLVAKEVREEE